MGILIALIGLMVMRDVSILIGRNDLALLSVTNDMSVLAGLLISIAAFLAVIVIDRAIRGQKTKREALIESEERYRHLIESTRDLVQSIGPDERILFANRAWMETLGYTEAELSSLNLFEIIHPDSVDHCRDIFSRVIAGETFNNIEAAFVSKDGRSVLVEGNVIGRYLNGKLIATHGLFRDVTEQKRAEQALRESEAKFRSLSETTPSAIVMYQDDKVRYANPAMESLTGYSREELLKMSIWDLIHPESQEMVKQRRLAFQRGESVIARNELKFVTKSREDRWCDYAAGFIEFDGKPATIGTAFDVTDRKRTEEELFRRNKELATISAANAALTKTLDLQTVLETMLDYLRQMIPYDTANIMIRKSDDHVAVVALRGYEQWTDAKLTRQIEFDVRGNRIIQEMFDSHKSILIPDTEKHEDWEKATGAEHVRSWIGVPLVVGGEAIGLYSVDKAEPDFFTQEHLRLAESLAMQSAVAIQNARLHQQLRQHAIELEERLLERQRAEDALRESEERYRVLFETAPDAVAVFDSEFTLTMVNRHGVELFGYENAQEMIGKKGYDFVAPEDKLRAIEQLSMPMEAENRKYLQYTSLKKDGTRFPTEGSASLIAHVSGKSNAIIGVMRDITERKRTEEALRESEERLRLALDAAQMGTFDWDIPTNRITWSRWHEELWGFAPGEFDGTYEAFSKRVHPDDLPGINAEVSRCIADRERFSREYRVVWPDGSVRWVAGNGEFEFSADGQPMQMRGVVMETTERKRAEEALRRSEARYRSVIEDQTEFIVRWLPDGTRTFVNESYCCYFGLSPDEAIGSSFYQLITEEDKKVVRERIRSMTPENPFTTGEHRVVRLDGTEGWNSWTDRAIFDDEGRLIEFQSVGRDITERKRAEELLRNSREELRALSAHLQSVREEERTRIAREVHDELGQALTGLKMDLSWLMARLSQNDDTPISELIRKADGMSGLIDDTVKSVRRISTELRPGILDDIGLEAAIEWQAQDFQDRFDLECSVNSSFEDVELDQARSTAVFRIFQETLTNIARHANATKVNIGLKVSDGSVILKVKDDGSGIPKNKIEGSGSFGLLGMRERALILGGSVDIKGSPNKGTTVTVQIPLE